MRLLLLVAFVRCLPPKKPRDIAFLSHHSPRVFKDGGYRKWRLLEERASDWICPVCLSSVLPFAEASISTDENVHEELLDNSVRTNTHGTDQNIPSLYSDLYTKLKGHGLKIAHLNVRSLIRKISEVKLIYQKANLTSLQLQKHIWKMKHPRRKSW